MWGVCADELRLVFSKHGAPLSQLWSLWSFVVAPHSFVSIIKFSVSLQLSVSVNCPLVTSCFTLKISCVMFGFTSCVCFPLSIVIACLALICLTCVAFQKKLFFSHFILFSSCFCTMCFIYVHVFLSFCVFITLSPPLQQPHSGSKVCCHLPKKCDFLFGNHLFYGMRWPDNKFCIHDHEAEAGEFTCVGLVCTEAV